MFSSRRVACTRHADTRETDQVKQPAVFRLLDGGERERERGGTGARFEAGGRMINASEPADMQQMRDAFVPSFLPSFQKWKRVHALKDPPTATELRRCLPRNRSFSFSSLSLSFFRSIESEQCPFSEDNSHPRCSAIDRDGRLFGKEIERGDDKIG